MEKTNNDRDLNLDVILEKLSGLSDAEFLDLGNGGLSYIKLVDGATDQKTYALHAADGSHIATGQDIATLHVIAKQQDLISMTIQ